MVAAPPEAVAGYEDLPERFEMTLTQGMGSLGFDFHPEGGFLHGSQLVKEGCIRAMGLSVSVMVDESRGSHELTANEELMGRFVMIRSQGKERLEFEGGFLFGIQYVMEGCIRVVGLSVSVMEDEFPGSHERSANEESMGRFVMIRSQGKESLSFDYQHERGFLHGIQFALEDCTQVKGHFVSVTEADIQGSLARSAF